MQCPKCGVEIKRFDIARNCRNCGVNIMLFTQEEDLSKDAKKTELEFAKARSIVGKIKLTYVGTKASIARLVLFILSIGAFAIPVLKLAIRLPLVETDLSTGAIGVYSLFTNGLLNQLLNLLNVGVEGALAKATAAHFIFFVLAFLMEACALVTYLLAAIKIRRGSKFLAIFSGIGCLFDLGMIITMFIVRADAAGSSSVFVTVYPGAFVILAMQLAFLIINIVMYRQNPDFVSTEIDMKRIETLAKIKAGEIKYSDLSLPVFESEEETEKRKNLFGAIYEGAKEEDDS